MTDLEENTFTNMTNLNSILLHEGLTTLKEGAIESFDVDVYDKIMQGISRDEIRERKVVPLPE